MDLANDLARDELVAPYLQDAPFAQSWYLNSFTHDKGINDQLIKYYADAVNASLGGGDSAQATAALQQGTSQVLRQYGVTAK